MFNNTEELILFIITFAGLVNGYMCGCLSLLEQYLDWRLECKKWLYFACDETCMCGDSVDSHSCLSNHSVVTQRDWAFDNMPKLRFE